MVEKTTVVADKPIDFNAFHSGADEKTQLPNGFLYKLGNDLIEEHNKNHSDKPLKKEKLTAEGLIEAGRISILQAKALSEISKRSGLHSQINMAALTKNPISLADSPNALAVLEAEVDRIHDMIDNHIQEECEEESLVGAICHVVGGWFSSNKHCQDIHKNNDQKMKELAAKAKHHDKHDEHKGHDKHKKHDAKNEHLGELFPLLYGAPPCPPKQHEQHKQ